MRKFNPFDPSRPTDCWFNNVTFVREPEKEIFGLIDASADLIGSLAGVSIGVSSQRRRGILTGAAAGPGIARAFRYRANFVKRLLTGREITPVGVVWSLAAHKMKQRLDKGERPRNDGFFEQDVTGRSPADDIEFIAPEERNRWWEWWCNNFLRRRWTGKAERCLRGQCQNS